MCGATTVGRTIDSMERPSSVRAKGGGSTEVDDTKKSTRMLDEIRGRDPGVGAVCELRLLEFGARK